MGGQSKLLILLLGIVVILAGLHPDMARQTLDQAAALISRWWPHGAAPSSSADTQAVAPAGAGTQTAAPPASGPRAQTQAIVETYMQRLIPSGATLAILKWYDFSAYSNASAITVSYRVRRPAQPDVQASVRFLVQEGRVINSQIVPGGPRRIPAPVYIDRFSAPLSAAIDGPAMTLHLSDAYSLAQLDQARAMAEAERKPLGFIMVWGQFFEQQEEGTRGSDSVSALVHFYQVFHQNLVLVFVRHETELGLVPAAVKAGFSGPDEGGYAPNMAVVDASATEFITEIPYRDLDGPGRDQLFAEGGRKIDQWLATHPQALPTPAGE